MTDEISMSDEHNQLYERIVADINLFVERKPEATRGEVIAVLGKVAAAWMHKWSPEEIQAGREIVLANIETGLASIADWKRMRN